MSAPRAVILAAGKGTRMGSDLPKVLHEVAGRPMIHRLLDAVEAAGCRRTVVVVGYGAARVKAALRGRDVAFALQDPPRGTGHALQHAAPALKGHAGALLVLPGDAPLVRASTLRSLLRLGNAVLTTVLDNPTGYGRVLHDEAGAVCAIVEEANADPGTRRIREVNSGIYAFEARRVWPLLKGLPPVKARKGWEIYLTDLLPALARQGVPMSALEAPDREEALGINTPRELLAAEAVLRRRFVEDLLERGVKVADPATTFFETEVPVGEGTVIHPFTVVRRDVRIGRNCHVGPFAHLREGTVLEDGAEIGDFVETKKARLKGGAKAKHLAYLGDVTVGRKANIGAGTIVANYDGKAKHPTVVGDGAFIGSGTVLVAPVRVGKNAMTGAGSVVTRNRHVPDGAVVVGVPARRLKRR